MKNANTVILALALVLGFSLACKLLAGHTKSPYGVGDIAALPVPVVEPNSPFPALSTEVLDRLAAEIPALEKQKANVLEAERTALNALLADARSHLPAAHTSLSQSDVSRNEGDRRSAANFGAPINIIPTAYAADDAPEVNLGGLEYVLIGNQMGFFTPDLEKAGEADRGQSKTVQTKGDTSGEVIATRTTSVDSDGTVNIELATNINMPVLGLNANSRVKLTGNQCPDANGKVSVSIETSSNGRAGSSGSTIYDKTISGKIRAAVNDNADLTDIEFDLKQATRSTAGGRQVYLETSQSGRSRNGTYAGFQFGDAKVDRASSQATSADEGLSRDGMNNAFRLAHGVLDNAVGRWKGGGCVKIEAPSPGSVKPSSTTQIPVKVIHLTDRSEVPSRLETALSGGSSVEPAVLPKTAGTLTYVAPGEAGKTATLKLTAISRRGRATLDLTASTGGDSYRVSGSSNGVSFTGEICSLNKPFTIDAKFPGGTATTTFSPGGSTTVSGGGGGCTHSGGGNYTVTLSNDGSGTVTWTTTDKIACSGFSNSRTATFTLPLQPAPDLSCP